MTGTDDDPLGLGNDLDLPLRGVELGKKLAADPRSSNASTLILRGRIKKLL